ncbi:MAG: DUF4347 domain-containing protein, partial [Spirulina sp. SIO3F2]|nr:DUF4347 domain-containing protein [Spirulina sp. SIO3F2]
MPKLSVWLGGAFLVSLVFSQSAIAQSITANLDGTGTIIIIDGNTYHIEGGTQAGANLFHSFQNFGLSSGEIANFLSHPSINNILGRVVGGNASIIDGLIQANPNLYLMNPAGIVFGANASLNVGGDFLATTADRIGFEQGWFNATGANDYAALVGAPNQFAFLSAQPGAILNFGDLTTEQNVSLVGGTVLNQGKVVATQGNVTLAAIPGERFVKISQPGMLLSLEIPTHELTAEITPVDLPTLLTGRGSALVPTPARSGATTGGLPLPLQNGDVMIAGEISGQQVDLYAAGKVTPTEADLVQGDTRVIRFSATGENPAQVVFIDARADNPTDLLFGAEAGTIAQLIERDENGVSVISEQLAVISESVGELESVAIVAEGNEGNFWLGNQWIRSENIADYAAQLQTWGEALTTNADILLYSCFTALGATGEALVQSIADMTGADVAASVNATGSSNYGGDWVLEHSTGEMGAGNPFSVETLANWDGKLATHTVTDFTDGGGANTLRMLIGGAAAGDTVIFASASTVTLAGTRIFWGTDNLTIDGNGGTVDGNNTSSIFYINANNATIQNLTIQNGTFGGSGGGFYHDRAGELKLENVNISGNSAGLGGGAFRSSASVITINNSMISGNSASVGGGINDLGASLSINNSIISGNSASIGGGGVLSDSGAVTITNSLISNNLAKYVGGIGSSGAITITNSMISGNSAVDRTGGISTDSSTITVRNSKISGNFSAEPGGDIRSVTGIIEVTDHVGDLSLDIYARRAVTISGTGSITVTGDIQTNSNPLTLNAAGNIDLVNLNLPSTEGGDITLTAGGNINTKNLFTSGSSGGDITFTSGGSINTFNGTYGSLDTRANSATGDG